MTNRYSRAACRGRFKGSLMAAAALGLALATAAPASAATVVLTWRGTTSAGVDNSGLFGDATNNFQSTAYVATYVFDTAVSYFENTTNGSQSVSGGTFYVPFRSSPLVSASITINGFTRALGGSYASEYFSQSGQGFSILSALAQADPALDQGGYPNPYTSDFFNRVFRPGNFYGLPFDQPAHYDFTSADNPGGNFSFAYRDANNNIISNTGFNLRPDSLDITLSGDPGGIPEPATWALMILGFGLVGGAMRKHRRQQPSALKPA